MGNSGSWYHKWQPDGTTCEEVQQETAGACGFIEGACSDFYDPVTGPGVGCQTNYEDYRHAKHWTNCPVNVRTDHHGAGRCTARWNVNESYNTQ